MIPSKVVKDKWWDEKCYWLYWKKSHINFEMHCWLKPVSTCKLDDLFLISYNCIPPTPPSPPSQPSSLKLNGNSLQLDGNQSRYLSVSIAGGNKAIAFAAADKKTAFASWSTFERWKKWGAVVVKRRSRHMFYHYRAGNHSSFEERT